MKLREVWSRLWRRIGAEKADEEMSYSIVLLLREFHFFSQEEWVAAGQKGWGKRFDGEQDPMYFVVQTGGVTMIKAGVNLFSVMRANSPYLDDLESVARLLPQEEQKKAWLAHRAWVAIDLINLEPGQGKTDAYEMLARFARHLGDSNCSGIYLPKEEILLPNNGAADQGLQMMIERKLPVR